MRKLISDLDVRLEVDLLAYVGIDSILNQMSCKFKYHRDIRRSCLASVAKKRHEQH
jgi:hypothetical protein